MAGPLASVGAALVVQAVAVRIRVINSGAIWFMRLMNPISLDIGIFDIGGFPDGLDM